MLPKAAYISPVEPSAERRGAVRRVVTLGLDVAETRGNTRVLILNLSRTGLLLQTSAELEVGETIQIDVPEAGQVEAKIVRQNGDQFGAMFDNPIKQAAISAVLLAAPARPEPLAREEIAAAHRSHPSYEPVPDWLPLAILAVTACATAFFVYALSFLPITG
ncbi:PilZ domain-containing protein [Altererythrobacter sp.]|uniref:PilZ domain-containing protein n=1 Tax=Altererythrobacter sp. TaxID=1872480 RepID=UPI003D014A7D